MEAGSSLNILTTGFRISLAVLAAAVLLTGGIFFRLQIRKACVIIAHIHKYGDKNRPKKKHRGRKDPGHEPVWRRTISPGIREGPCQEQDTVRLDPDPGDSSGSGTICLPVSSCGFEIIANRVIVHTGERI